jgi:hypothetical protein
MFTIAVAYFRHGYHRAPIKASLENPQTIPGVLLAYPNMQRTGRHFGLSGENLSGEGI